ncbi:MAG: DUF885 domain-containing protein [Acidobacteriota bacterium]
MSGANGEGFDRLGQEYLDASLRLQPTRASSLGYHACDGLLEDMSEAGLREAAGTFQRFRARMEGIDPKRLDLRRRIDHALLLHDIRYNLFLLEKLQPHRWDPSIVNDILGYSTLFLTLLPSGAPEWAERLQSLCERMAGYPRLLDQAREVLSDPSRIHVEFVVGANQANIRFFEETVPQLAERAPHLRGDLERGAAGAIAALRRYQRWLEEDLLPRAQRGWRLGRALWEEKLRFTLESDLSPESIRERAEAALREERAAMLAIAEPLHEKLYPGHTHPERGEARIDVIVPEVIARVSESHSRPDRIYEDVQRWLEKIRRFLAQHPLVTLPPPSDPFVVEPTPGFLNGLAVAFFNPPPAFEPHLKKSFWISSVEGKPEGFVESFLREYNDYALQDLTVHEAFPGHYVQFWHALGSPVASIYQKVYASSTFAEGWAVLAEKTVYDAGYADGEPENLLIHKKMQLRTYINALLDQRFHVTPEGEASDDELDAWAMDLMCRAGFQERAEAEGKIRRAKVSSTQLSTYFVGFLELDAIREQARRTAGDAFDLQVFHDKLLSYGTIPPRRVRMLLQQEGVL